jgi:hypothetical protein
MEPGIETIGRIPAMTHSLSSLSVVQLKKAVRLKEQLSTLESDLAAILGGTAAPPTPSASVSRRRGRPPGRRGATAQAGLLAGHSAPTSPAPAAAGRQSGAKPVKIKEHDIVSLAFALPGEGLGAKANGTVVHLYGDGQACEVEFVTPHRSKVVTLSFDQIKSGAR